MAQDMEQFLRWVAPKSATEQDIRNKVEAVMQGADWNQDVHLTVTLTVTLILSLSLAASSILTLALTQTLNPLIVMGDFNARWAII